MERRPAAAAAGAALGPAGQRLGWNWPKAGHPQPARGGGCPVNSLALVLTVFIACAVEAVEALTIVLAAGLTREWRSALQGLAAALAVLAAVVAVVGPALTLVPLTGLRLVVGALLAV